MYRAPAAERNKEPIRDVLAKYLLLGNGADGAQVKLLEVASGCGTHAAFLATHLPHVDLQPTECEAEKLTNILGLVLGLENVRKPLVLDVTAPADPALFAPASYDAVFNANMVHISPWDTAVGLFLNAGTLLRPKGLLFTYGPYAEGGVLEPESNRNFDLSLKSRDPGWGIRDVDDLKKEAEKNGIELEDVHEMPANNKLLVWRKK